MEREERDPLQAIIVHQTETSRDVAYIKEAITRLSAAVLGNGGPGLVTRMSMLEMQHASYVIHADEERIKLCRKMEELIALKNKLLVAIVLGTFSGGGFGALLQALSNNP
jgi:hypothetical protein